MFRLTLLGSLGIEAADGSSPDRATQPRQLALLALLAASEAPLTRDKLVGYLWPEEGDSRARRRLSDTLYVLRRELGSEAIVAQGDTLALDPTVIDSDLAGFAAGLDAGDLEKAASLYGGDFLDGFHLSGTVAFERWVDRRRQRFAERYRVALETLASSAAERGELRAAVHWRRRRVAEEPYSSLAVRRLVEALVEMGDRPAALQAARAHEQRIRSDLDASPDAEFVELVKELRESDVEVGSRPVAMASRPPPPDARPGEDTGASPGSESREPEGKRRDPPFPRSAGHTGGRRGAFAVVSLVLGILALTAVVWTGVVAGRGGDGASEVGSDPAVAVLPWAVGGDAPHLGYLEQGLSDLMSLALDGAPGVRSVDPRSLLMFVGRACGDPTDPGCGGPVARRFEAGRYLKGTVVPLDGEGFELWGSVHDADGTQLRRTTVRVDGDDPSVAVQVLGHRLGLLPSPPARSVGDGPESGRGTGPGAIPLPALRAYLEGEKHVRSARFDEAIRAFRRAVSADSTFALAWCRLAATAEMLGGSAAWRLADSATSRAVRRADGLPDRHRRLVRALDHLRRGAAREAERELLDLVAAYPHDFAAWHLLGEVRYHYNVVWGRPPDGEAAFRRVLELDPDFRPALWHLRLQALSERRIADFDSLTARFLAVAAEAPETTGGPDGDAGTGYGAMERLYASLARADHRLVALLRADDSAVRERWFAELEHADGDELAWIAGLHFEHLSWPDRRGDAARMARLLLRPERSRSERGRGFVIVGSIALREGRWRDALASLDSLQALDPARAALWRADWASTPYLDVPAETSTEIRAKVAEVLADSTRPRATGLPLGPVGWTTRAPPDVRAWGMTGLAMLSTRLGEHDEALSYAARLAADRPARAHDLRLALLAQRYRERGDWSSARGALDSLRYEVRWDQLTATLHPQLFLRAEVLYALDELEAARPWYALWTHLTGSRFLGPALFRLGRIHEAKGETAKALSRYGEFVSLWKAADPELQPRVKEARARIRELEGSGR